MRVAERVAVAVLLLAVAAFTALRGFYPRVLYPAPQQDEHAAAAGEVVALRAADGVAVHALSFGLPPGAPVLVYFHGNGVVMGDIAWMARELAQRGLGVVVGLAVGAGVGDAVAVGSAVGDAASAATMIVVSDAELPEDSSVDSVGAGGA